jgi:hypothetical protein
MGAVSWSHAPPEFHCPPLNENKIMVIGILIKNKTKLDQ